MMVLIIICVADGPKINWLEAKAYSKYSDVDFSASLRDTDAKLMTFPPEIYLKTILSLVLTKSIV